MIGLHQCAPQAAPQASLSAATSSQQEQQAPSDGPGSPSSNTSEASRRLSSGSSGPPSPSSSSSTGSSASSSPLGSPREPLAPPPTQPQQPNNNHRHHQQLPQIARHSGTKAAPDSCPGSPISSTTTTTTTTKQQSSSPATKTTTTLTMSLHMNILDKHKQVALRGNPISNSTQSSLNNGAPMIERRSSLTPPSATTATATSVLLVEDERQLLAGSPGYHSAASSPGAASPVSSASSTTSSACCSTTSSSSASSGLSTAGSLLLASAEHSSPTPTGAPASPPASEPIQQPHHHLMGITSLANQQQPRALVATSGQQQPQLHNNGYPQQQQQASCTPSTKSFQQQQQAQVGQVQHLLDHFPLARQDGLNLSWWHEANSRSSLTKALQSSRLIVAGDISLAEMSRYPMPIMAKPPLGSSDLTLEHWLTDVLAARKAIKLTFTSTRTVEPAFRVLARHADQLRGPLILSADILTRPATSSSSRAQGPQATAQNKQQPVDAWTFLMLCRTRFPKSIISIGWCQSSCGPEQQHQAAASVVDQAVEQRAQLLNPMAAFEFDSMMEQQNQQRLAAFHNQRQLISHGQHQSHRLSSQPQTSGSSAASLNSSSGNSSGSPSPTSPLGHQPALISSATATTTQTTPPQTTCPNIGNVHHQQRHSFAHLGQHAAASQMASQQRMRHSLGATHAPGWSSAMAAAAMVAQLQQQQQQEQDHLPLNLNINEADPQHAVSRLSELAQTIQTLQQQSSNLNSLSSSLFGGGGGLSTSGGNQHHQAGKAQAVQALALASKLLNGQQQQQQLLLDQIQAGGQWEHVSKKTALCHQLNSNSPSPVNSNQLLMANKQSVNLLACAPTTHKSVAMGARHQQMAAARVQQAAAAGIMNHESNGPSNGGYTREMIDKMASLVKEYNLSQAITFAIEARLLQRHQAHFGSSLNELKRLLYQVGANATLTLVAQPDDLISVDDLLLIRKHFAQNQILFDLPEELASALRHELS